MSVKRRSKLLFAYFCFITGLSSVAHTADAEASQEANPDLDQIRALLRAHDEAFTSQDLSGIMACFTEKAAKLPLNVNLGLLQR
jgi:hypothetical protein